MNGISSSISKITLVAAIASVILSAPAHAVVMGAEKNGFEVKETVHIAATPEDVYTMIAKPYRWWSSQHTFSGNAANLSMEPRAGACWCERIPGGGSVQHMQVVYAKPYEILRLRGALGPLQALPVISVMTWQLIPAGQETNLVLDFTVGGYDKSGFSELAKGVDGILGEQVVRLKRQLETGNPDVPKH